MSATPTRVAVQLGAATVRVAGAEAGGEPWLVAELPAPGPGMAALLADLAGPHPEELLLVHPASWAPARVARWVRHCVGLAGWVHAVAAPRAAAGPGAHAVLDVGYTGAEATRLGPDGRVLACRTCPVGGARLDAAVAALLRAGGGAGGRAEARRVREALSLLAGSGGRSPGAARITADELAAALAAPLGAAVEALREVLALAGPAPVLLVGGVARTPVLAELVDAAGIDGAVVAPRPDAAAVLGALARPAPGAGRPPAEPPPVARRLPAPPPRRPLRTVLLAGTAAAAVAALLAAGALLPPPPAVVPAGTLVQYGYRLDVPAGWEHTGGLPGRRRTLLTPVATPEGSDLIAVERSPLGYDTGAEPERARAELRAEFDAAVAAGSRLSDYRPAARAGGRPVTAYRQHDIGGRVVVEWFVVLDGDAQLSVGCGGAPGRAEAVRAACEVVIGSVRRS